MTLIKFEPFRDFETIHDKMQRFFGNALDFGFSMDDSFYPRIDINEDKNKFHVFAEIPGVKKDEIKITLQDNILTIEGEKKKESAKEEKNYHRSERLYGSFRRSFTLPAEVDSEKVEAKFENGILDLQLNKVEPKKKEEKIIELK
jgi:HSP20 family protein